MTGFPVPLDRTPGCFVGGGVLSFLGLGHVDVDGMAEDTVPEFQKSAYIIC